MMIKLVYKNDKFHHKVVCCRHIKTDQLNFLLKILLTNLFYFETNLFTIANL